jgi:CHAD domain-containing protein
MDSLVTYYSKLCSDYRKYLERAIQHQDAESVHQLRIAIKKLKALFSLIEFSDPSFESKKYLIQYIEVFKAAGEIRDISITVKLIGKQEKNLFMNIKRLSAFLQQEKIRKMPKIKKIFTKVQVKNNSYDEKITQIIKNKIDSSKMDAFLSNIHKELEERRKKRTSRKDLHKFRKLLKKYFYISQIAKENFRLRVDNISLKRIDKLQDLLGSWHDRRTAKNIINDHKKNALSTGIQKEELSGILQGLKKKEKKLRTKTKKALRKKLNG